MERMTTQKPNGDWTIANIGLYSKEKVYEKFQIAVNRLAEYENTRLTPTEIKDLKNELCLLCGKYRISYPCHCNDCRWRKGKD